MVKVALIGAGCMGRVHAAAYRKLDDAELIAVCDLDTKRAQELGPRAEVSSDYQDILNDPNIDMVDICLPTFLHKEAVIQAANAGKHVLCEKPIARTVEDGELMVKACEEAGVKFSVGHVVRFFPDFAKLKDVLASGQIGEAKVIRSSRGGGFPTWGWQNWYADYEKSGGPLVDLIIHDFDFLRWVFGPVDRVFAKSLTGRYENLDYSLVTLRFANGMVAHVEGSWAEPPGTPFAVSLEVAGTKGLYQYSNQQSMPVILRTRQGEAVPKAVPESPLLMEPYTRQIDAFIQSILDKQSPTVSGHEAIESLRISLAACRSAETGAVIHLGGGSNA